MALVQNIVFGLAQGSYIAIAAIGFTLIYGIVDMIDFAYGEYMTVAAFLGFVATGIAGLPLPVAVVVAMLGGAVFLYGISRAVFVPIEDAGPIPMLLTSIGVGLVVRNAVRLTAGAQAKFIEFPFTGDPYRFGFLPQVRAFDVALLGRFYVSRQHLAIIGLAVAVFAGIHLLLTRTEAGVAMRAVADNEDLSRITGINTHRIRTHVWLLAGALAGLSGIMLGIQTNVSAGLGFGTILSILAAAILGGAGSPYGAIVGAYVIGLVISLSTALLPTAATELGTAMSFLVLILVLLIRPSGIAGAEVRAA